MITTLFGEGVIPITPSAVRPKASRTTPPPEVERPSRAEQEPIAELYQADRYVGAYELARAYGPLPAWTGTSARILAGCLASYVGGSRLGQALHLKALRHDPLSPQACFYAAGTLLDRQGGAPTWAWMRERGEMTEAPPDLRADWVALQAVVAARFRDFDTAWTLLRRSEGIAPTGTWRLLQRAWILELQDDHDEALETAQRAHRGEPASPMAIRELARFLHVAG
jgi:hypothetical protein